MTTLATRRRQSDIVGHARGQERVAQGVDGDLAIRGCEDRLRPWRCANAKRRDRDGRVDITDRSE